MLLVIGPGSLGTLLAATLARAGHPVTLLDRDPARAARLGASPLRVTSPSGEIWEAQVPVTTTPPPGVEIAFLCVKSHSSAAALEPVRDLDCSVAVLQNGCEPAAQIGELLAPARVVGASTTVGANLLSEGHVAQPGTGETFVGPLVSEGAARAARVVEVLAPAGWGARAGDVGALSWRKLQINAAINALTGLLDCPNGDLLRSEAASELADAAAREVALVAQARGVPGDWDPDSTCSAWREVALHTKANISSTLRDLRRSQTTEVHAINGAVARLAALEGLAAPTNLLLYRLVTAREELALDDSLRD